MHRLLTVLNTSDVDAAAGHAAARGDAAGVAPAGVDSIVAASADALAARDDVLIVTRAGGDFEMLGSRATNSNHLSVLPV